jgi:DNA-binding IclR family transcriptional regulator
MKPDAPSQDGRTARRSLAPTGLEIIEALTPYDDGLGITDLARLVRLEVAQAHRIVRELIASGWLAQDSVTSLYRVTGALLALAGAQLQKLELRNAAMPTLRRLTEATGETVVLAEFRAGQLYCVARELSDSPILTWAQIGERWQMGSAAAIAKAVEAAVVASGELQLFPRDYRPSPDRLAVLEEVSVRGWSSDDALYRPGGSAVAACIFDLQFRPIGAIGVAWPGERIPSEGVAPLGQRVHEAASEISSRLGYRVANQEQQWATVAEQREEDLFRHLRDLREMSYEGAVGRQDQVQTFDRAVSLLRPVVEQVLAHFSRRLLADSGTIEYSRTESDEHGIAATWSLSWPEQRAAIVRVSGQPLPPISIVGRLRPAHIHGHLGSSYFGDWPMQITSLADARRQFAVISAIVEAECHQRVFEAGGAWRLIPAYSRRAGATLSPSDGSGAQATPPEAMQIDPPAASPLEAAQTKPARSRRS